MAAGTKLVLTFLDSIGAKRDFTFKYARANATAAHIKTLAQTIIANGSIFTNIPVTARKAVLETTTETDVDISE